MFPSGEGLLQSRMRQDRASSRHWFLPSAWPTVARAAPAAKTCPDNDLLSMIVSAKKCVSPA